MLHLSVCSFSYYMINLNMKNVKGTLLVNTFSSSLAEISAVIISGYFFSRVGARAGLFTTFSTSAVGSILLIIINNQPSTPEIESVYIPLFVFIAKFGISAAFTMNYISFVELTPTIFTATIIGYCNVTSRLLTILAPQLAELHGNTPNFVTLSIASASAIASLGIITKLPNFI